MFGSAAMGLSSFCVVINALRLRGFKPRVHIPILAPGAAGAAPMEFIPKTKQEVNRMTKTMTIEGMSCEHCSGRVEKALNAVDGVQAIVDLAAKTANITITGDISNDTLTKAVVDSGYEVTGLQ